MGGWWVVGGWVGGGWRGAVKDVPKANHSNRNVEIGRLFQSIFEPTTSSERARIDVLAEEVIHNIAEKHGDTGQDQEKYVRVQLACGVRGHYSGKRTRRQLE